jgi:transcriptional regulator with XRE-family HTH domain
MGIRPYAQGDMAGRPPSSEAPLLGKRLAALRKERGLTQLQLAEALGVSQSVVAYYERRAGNPSLEVLQKLAAFYSVSVADLLGPEATKKRAKPGPPSGLEERIGRIRRLPRREQARILDIIDVAIASAERRVGD